MTLVWQNLVAIGFVAIAILYVTRQAWLVVAKRKFGCGSECSSCPVSEDRNGTARPKPLVTTEELMTNFEKKSAK